MVRLIHRQHIIGERADERRHPPPQAGGAAVLAQREHRAVLQHAGRRVVGGREPDFPDDREAGLDHRSARPQSLDAGGWIAEKLLTGEVNAHCHQVRA